MNEVDVLVVGAGVVGLAHAAEAHRRGLRVALYERRPRAVGASIRNFGMIWPVGQRPGTDRDRALRSRERWLELAGAAGFWCAPCGSLHAVHAGDELAVLEEFVAGDGRDLDCDILSPEAARKPCPGLKPDRLKGALWSPYELAVDPREAIAKLAAWLDSQENVSINFGNPVVRIDDRVATTASGETCRAERIFICAGADFETLFPEAYAAAPLTRCKLQMMRTAPQPGGWKLGPHLAGGLTLRHYAAFENCPSLAKVRDRVTAEEPRFDAFGIHVMAAQNHLGELVIGDSHVYGDEPDPFDSDDIDDLILAYLRNMLDAPDLTPAARWNGTYLKRTDGGTSFIHDVASGVRIVNALSGAGMTLSMGVAEEQFDG